jgi:hypothetical protein
MKEWKRWIEWSITLVAAAWLRSTMQQNEESQTQAHFSECGFGRLGVGKKSILLIWRVLSCIRLSKCNEYLLSVEFECWNFARSINCNLTPYLSQGHIFNSSVLKLPSSKKVTVAQKMKLVFQAELRSKYKKRWYILTLQCYHKRLSMSVRRNFHSVPKRCKPRLLKQKLKDVIFWGAIHQFLRIILNSDS